jgi:hypothetical protein
VSKRPSYLLTAGKTTVDKPPVLEPVQIQLALVGAALASGSRQLHPQWPSGGSSSGITRGLRSIFTQLIGSWWTPRPCAFLQHTVVKISTVLKDHHLQVRRKVSTIAVFGGRHHCELFPSAVHTPGATPCCLTWRVGIYGILRSGSDCY